MPSRRIVWPNPGAYHLLTYSRLLDDLMGEKNSPVRVSPIVSTVISSVCTPTKQESVEVEIMAGQKQAISVDKIEISILNEGVQSNTMEN